MVISDACVFAYPAGNTSLRRLALEAKHLGIERLVCAGPIISGNYYGVDVVSGALLRPKDFRDFSGQLKKAKNPDLVMACAGDAGLNRSLLSSGGPDILRGLECAPKKAFDDVCAVNAADKGTAIDIDLSAVTRKRGIFRQKALISFEEILKFQRKFEFNITISSGAHSCIDLLSIRDIENICSLFGMEKSEVKTALNTVDKLLNPYSPVEVLNI
ncbi:MAG: RNase P subunit p30 family protein [Methanomicrobium sp.]|nr:RNase P subunit p30 family protein [Methanomicrobium sp.]